MLESHGSQIVAGVMLIPEMFIFIAVCSIGDLIKNEVNIEKGLKYLQFVQHEILQAMDIHQALLKSPLLQQPQFRSEVVNICNPII